MGREMMRIISHVVSCQCLFLRNIQIDFLQKDLCPIWAFSSSSGATITIVTKSIHLGAGHTVLFDLSVLHTWIFKEFQKNSLSKVKIKLPL